MSRSRMWTEETTTRGSTEDLLPRGNEQGKESTQIYRPKIFFPTSSSSSFFLSFFGQGILLLFPCSFGKI